MSKELQENLTKISTEIEEQDKQLFTTKIRVRPEEDAIDENEFVRSQGNIVDPKAKVGYIEEPSMVPDVPEEPETLAEDTQAPEIAFADDEVFTGEKIDVAINWKDIAAKFKSGELLDEAKNIIGKRQTVFNPKKLSTDEEAAIQIETLAKDLKLDKFKRIKYKDIADSLNRSGYEYDDKFVQEIIAKAKEGGPTIADPYTVFKEFHFLSSVGKKTKDLAKQVVENKRRGVIDKNLLVEFQHMLTLEGLMARRLKGQQVDIARSLGVLREARKPGDIKNLDEVISQFDEYSSSINPLGKGNDGQSVIESLAEKYDNALDNTQRRLIAEGNGKPFHKRIARIISNVYTTGLVSGIPTHARNLLGFFSLSHMTKVENIGTWGFGKIRQGISKFNKYLPEKLQTDPSDRMRMVQVIEEGKWHFGLIGDALQAFWQTARHNRLRDRATKIDYENPVGRGDFEDLTGSPIIDRVAKFTGTASTYHGRLLAAEDEAMKSFGFYAKLKSEALRRKVLEKERLIDEGTSTDEAERLSEEFFVNIMKDPSDEMLEIATEHSRYLTHTQDLEGGLRALENMTQNPLLKVWAPFFKVTSNLVGSVLERNVYTAAISPRFWKNFNAGGVKRDAALSRMTTGSAISYYFSGLAMDGRVTGAGPFRFEDRQAMIAQGWQPYSFVIDSTDFSEETIEKFSSLSNVSVGKGNLKNRIFLSYQGIEPLSVLIAMGATNGEYAQLNPGDEDMLDLVAGSTFATMEYINSHPLLSGMGQIVDVLRADPKEGESAIYAKFAEVFEVYSNYVVNGFPNAGLPSEIDLNKAGIDAKIPTTPFYVESGGKKVHVGGSWSSWYARLETMHDPTKSAIKAPMYMQDQYNNNPLVSKWTKVLQRACSRNSACSSQIPRERDPLTGDLKYNGVGNLNDFYSPSKKSDGTNIGVWTVINEYNVGDPQLYNKYGNIDGVKLSDLQFDRLVEIATEDGLLENSILKLGEAAVNLPNANKADIAANIKKLISDAYSGAKQQLIMEDDELRERIQLVKELKTEALNEGQSLNKLMISGEEE